MITSLNKRNFEVNLHLSLTYVVKKAICALAAIQSRVFLSSATSCIYLAYVSIHLQHARQYKCTMHCLAFHRITLCCILMRMHLNVSASVQHCYMQLNDKLCKVKSTS